jgi:mono/diheme cytochrome c family protein
MKRGPALLAAFIALSPFAALAQSSGAATQAPSTAPSLDDKQRLGMRLFNQSCRVCHIKPQLTSPQFAPVLSKDTLGGNEDAIRAFIASGSARMPGFKTNFRPEEIDAIAAYVRTIGASAPASASGKPGAMPCCGNSSREAD